MAAPVASTVVDGILQSEISMRTEAPRPDQRNLSVPSMSQPITEVPEEHDQEVAEENLYSIGQVAASSR